MPIHSAIFRQPGPELNPLGVSVPSPIHVEVFEIERKKSQTLHSDEWTAREATSKTVFKGVGRQSSIYEARYRVAKLFLKQTGPWTIDGQPEPTCNSYHFHLNAKDPSLCGSRFHVMPATDLVILLPDARAGRRVLLPVEWDHLCPLCLARVDRAIAPGDKVRVSANGATGIVIGDTGGWPPHYVLKYDQSAQPATLPAGAMSLVMFEKDVPFS